jgi:hypothetical protein
LSLQFHSQLPSSRSTTENCVIPTEAAAVAFASGVEQSFRVCVRTKQNLECQRRDLYQHGAKPHG